MNSYTCFIRRDGDDWIGWIEEIPGVNCQESSREELIESLRVTLREAIEMNPEDALAAEWLTPEEDAAWAHLQQDSQVLRDAQPQITQMGTD